MFNTPISPKTNKQCQFRCIIYFNEQTTWNGQLVDKRLVKYAKHLEQHPQKAFDFLQKVIIDFYTGTTPPYEFTDLVNSEGEVYKGLASFKFGIIYNTFTDTEVFRLSKYDKNVDISISVKPKRKYPEVPNEKAIKNLPLKEIVHARKLWLSKGYVKKEIYSMGGGKIVTWYDSQKQRVC
jgi:hypothetical protein